MQKGITVIPIILVTVLLFIIFGVVILKFIEGFSSTPPAKSIPETFQIGGGAKQTACPDPFIFPLPVDIEKVTSVLYPGQVRGGDYKAHGGFRFDDSLPSEITVTAPYDTRVIAGARYPADTGDIQYTLDFEHPCGIRYRFGHLLTLSPKFQEIAEKFPLPKVLDSRTTQVYPPVEVKQGEIIATAVGLTREGNSKDGANTFVDWGIYDYRQKNESSKDPAWAVEHSSDTYQYGVCLFDWLSKEDQAKVLSLPSSDSQSGKKSDYCKLSSI